MLGFATQFPESNLRADSQGEEKGKESMRKRDLDRAEDLGCPEGGETGLENALALDTNMAESSAV
jgi:hypothetical protein